MSRRVSALQPPFLIVPRIGLLFALLVYVFLWVPHAQAVPCTSDAQCGDFPGGCPGSQTGMCTNSGPSGMECNCGYAGGGMCGNGVKDPGEECDGNDLGGSTCAGLDGNTVGGTPSCSDCQLNTAGCLYPSCGNGIKEPGEDCDFQDNGGALAGILGVAGLRHVRLPGGMGSNQSR